MNSINWPASSVWVFIAQLGEHCSANAEATGSNPVEAPKIFFSGYFRNCLNCDSLRWSHTNFTMLIQWTTLFCSQHKLLDAMSPLYSRLTEEELNRNKHGPCLLYTYDPNLSFLVPSSLPGKFPDVSFCHAR